MKKSLLMLALFSITSTLTAKPLMGEAPDVFKMFDANGDNKVTEQEYIDANLQRMKETFKLMDLDGDGVVTREENDEVMRKMRDYFQSVMPKR